MLTRDRIQNEIYEARERARRDAEAWKSALQRAEERAKSSEERAKWNLVQGRLQGQSIGQIRFCEGLLQQPLRPEEALTSMSLDDLQRLAETLRSELLSARPDEGTD